MIRSGARWAAVVAAALAAASVVVTADPALGSPVDLGWVTLLFAGLGAVLRLVARTVREELRARALVRRLGARNPAEVAARAVVEERARLAADVEAVVRASVERMRSLAAAAAAAWAGDPRPQLAEIQEEGQHAGTELRRLLGLLREAERAVPQVAGVPDADRTAVHGRDAALAAAAVVLAVVERHLYGDLRLVGPLGADTVASLLLTAGAAATVVLRRTRPGRGAVLASAAFLLGAIAGTPVSGGVWFVLVLGSLAWSAARRGGRSAFAALALVTATLVAQAWRWPENTEITALVVGVPAAGGLLAAWRDRSGRRARAEADRRAEQLAAAADDAVRRERLAVARELHDVVSHAVGVMVVQAAAAAALFPVDGERARSARDVVQRTADEALAELDRLVELVRGGALGGPPDLGGSGERGVGDLHQLVARMTAAGLSVDLQVDGAPAGDIGAATHRIVQESLTNVLRHAPGSNVRVTVAAGPGGLAVEVVDDGPGPGSASRRGYGLVGIRERVQRLGGELVLGSGPGGRGFRVTARWPLDRGRTGGRPGPGVHDSPVRP